MKNLGGLVVTGLIVGGIFAVVGAISLIARPEPEFKIPGKKPVFKVKEGDTIQWESMGTFMFPTPRKVVRIEECLDGKYVFVEGSKTGIPIEQVVPMDA